MSGIDPTKLDTCGCCEVGLWETTHENRPALSAVSYRVGTHPDLLERMTTRIHRWEMLTCAECDLRFVGPDRTQEIRSHLSEAHGLSGTAAQARIVSSRPLAELSTRARDDAAIALMDAWAVVGDVLTFYQERIANEAFLRTATERRSVLELARAIGYELDPGVAAEAYVAFTVDDAEGSPTQAPVPAGVRVQSLPASQDELPQTFETSKKLEARVAWNEMRPRLRHRQSLISGSTRIYLEGTNTGLEPGDLVLLTFFVFFVFPWRVVKRVVAVEADTKAQWTRIDLSASPVNPSTTEPSWTKASLDPTQKPLELTRQNVRNHVFYRTWTESDLQAFLTQHEWDEDDVLAYVADLLDQRLNGSGKLFALREKVGFFGHNAPRQETLPKWANTRGSVDGSADPYDKPWDGTDVRTIWQDSQGTTYTEADAYLERTVSDVTAESWAVFETSVNGRYSSAPQPFRRVFWIKEVLESSLVDYAMSGKATGLVLTNGPQIQFATKLPELKVRKTTAHVASEPLELTTVPVTDDLEKDDKSIVLGSMVLGLEEGQAVMLEGEQVDSDGTTRREVLVLDEISHGGGLTTLTFEDGLAHDYVRDTVTLNANVVLASHGETVTDEVLGSGDGSQAHQSFDLKKDPLTHVGAENASGSESTLTLRVDGVEWDEVSSLYGLDGASRSYLVKIDNEAVPSVVFGDGKSGARLPTGEENVKATYRSGIGLEGEVGAGSLTLLKTRPFGIRGVTNPLAASGAANPEKLADARGNAPLTVLTLDRIVSLRDYEDFARAYAGIGKAKAVAVWDGSAERVHITVADADGDEVVSPLYGRLLAAIEGARDPLAVIELETFQPYVFFVKAKVAIDDAYLWEDVESAVRQALLAAFGFEHRGFGQPVAAAEVLEVIHGVAGVEAVDLDELYKTAPEETPVGELFNSILESQPARWDQTTRTTLRAQLLLIHPLGIELSRWTP